MNFSGYAYLLNTNACCLVAVALGLWLGFGLGLDFFSCWLVVMRTYLILILLSVVIVLYPVHAVRGLYRSRVSP